MEKGERERERKPKTLIFFFDILSCLNVVVVVVAALLHKIVEIGKMFKRFLF